MSVDITKFTNIIYDEELHTYINGNIMVILNSKNKNNEEINNMTKNIIIDFYLHLNNIESNAEIYKLYSKYYDNILNENKIVKKSHISPPTPFNKTEEYIELCKIDKENDEWENDKRIHYNQYFKRYKDIEYIIEYYNKLHQELENKVYDFELEDDYVDSDNDEYYEDEYDNNNYNYNYHMDDEEELDEDYD